MHDYEYGYITSVALLLRGTCLFDRYLCTV